VTRAVRTPSRVDEDIRVAIFAAAGPPPTYAVIQGNRDLGVESVVASELGYRALLRSGLYLDLAVFRNAHDDVVDLGGPVTGTAVDDGVTYTAVTFPWVNGIEGTTRGFELAPDWQAAPRVRLRGSYSYLQVDLTAKPVNTGRLLLPFWEGSAPAHQVSLQSLVSLPGGVQIDPVYRYVSARESTGIEAYHTADVRLRLPIGSRVELVVAGQNLLQDHHAEWARDPGPPVRIRRAGYVRLIYRAP
jgi:iron complex outermembrane receptor protein